MRIIYDDPKRVVQWVAEKNGEEPYQLATGIGLEENGELVFGVVYCLQTGANIFLHIASDGTCRLHPAYIGYCFYFPFEQLECRRVTGIVRADNEEAIKFIEHLGFEREGKLRKSCSDGTDEIIFGMLKEECRFLEGKYNAALNNYFGFARSSFERISIGDGQESACNT